MGGAIIVAGACLIYIPVPKDPVSTDAAYVQADSAFVTPKLRGLIANGLVRHDQVVRRGDPLIKIDPEEFDAMATLDLALRDQSHTLIRAPIDGVVGDR